MARFEFKLPDIGEGVTEGEIVSWLVKEGDTVTEDQEMVEVMTDKATVTIGAPKAGRIAEIRGKEGDTVPVGDVLVVFELESGAGEAAAGEAKPEQPQAAKGQEVTQQERSGPEAAAPEPRQEGPAASAVGDIREVLPGTQLAEAARAASQAGGSSRADKGNGYYNDKPLAAPATRKLAREIGVDLRQVEPSGPGGRVTREDVERYQGSAGGGTLAVSTPAVSMADAAPRSAAKQPPAPSAEDERVPIRGVRKRIFENMARSKHTAAHFTYVDECDVGELRALRERVKPHADRADVKLTFLPFIVKACVLALKRHPELNCLVDDEKQEMIRRKTYDIGLAAATDAGLVVPVVRAADRLSILEIAKEVERLSADAREGRMKKEDLGGSSFTITSLGKLGGLFATPIVNYPEVAILGVHEMKRRPVVRGDEIAIGEVMLLSLSFDHRIIDGHVGAAFAQEIIGYLEEPERLLIEMS
jgi:pyruvate dehydrogenase E2 component (dihydrolipoamide acetyltransferase)